MYKKVKVNGKKMKFCRILVTETGRNSGAKNIELLTLLSSFIFEGRYRIGTYVYMHKLHFTHISTHVPNEERYVHVLAAPTSKQNISRSFSKLVQNLNVCKNIGTGGFIKLKTWATVQGRSRLLSL